MNEQGVRKFLLALGVSQGTIRSSKGWVNCGCPMAPYTHGSGIDEHPSFGISISEGRSVSYCFGCQPKAQQLEGLLHNIWVMSKEYPWEAADVFVHEENHEGEIHASVPDVWSEIKINPNPLPKEVLRLFPLLQIPRGSDVASACKNYLIRRGIPEWVQNMYQVRYDPKSGCVVFSLTDSSGRIFVMRERAFPEKRMWTVNEKFTGIELDYPKLNDIGVWFGMHLVNWARPVMLVEGEIKVMRLAALGEFNAVASCTSSISDAQIDALHAITLYLGFDADKAGALAHHRIVERLKDRAVMFELDWSVVGRKDPDELKNKRELEIVMKEARAI
jgi:hypothetical protein